MEKDWAIISRVYTIARLTKKFLMSLEEGCFLEQDVDFLYMDKEGKAHNMPKFGEYVAPLAEREEQWKRIVKMSANNRQCRVYRKKPSMRG